MRLEGILRFAWSLYTAS